MIFNDAEYKRVMGKAKTKRHPRCVTVSVPSEETNVMELVHAFEHPTCPHRELEVFAEFDARSEAMVSPPEEHVFGEQACDILMIRLNQQQEKFGLSVLFGAGRLRSVDCQIDKICKVDGDVNEERGKTEAGIDDEKSGGEETDESHVGIDDVCFGSSAKKVFGASVSPMHIGLASQGGGSRRRRRR